jgi:Zn-dependent oligopeptidase
LVIFCTRIRETDQIFAHVENKPADMESFMTFKERVSGNPQGNRHHTRHLLNQEFIQALLLHFREHGKKAIEKVARNQPAAYLKILAPLVPKEHKIEHSGSVAALTDAQLDEAIEAIQGMLAARAGDNGKVIEGVADAIALPAPEGGLDEKSNRRKQGLGCGG